MYILVVKSVKQENRENVVQFMYNVERTKLNFGLYNWEEVENNSNFKVYFVPSWL